MRLKMKVSKRTERPQDRATQEITFLKSITSHISCLQDAKFGAEGLSGICCFLEGQASEDEELGIRHLIGGLYEVTAALHRCLKRETDAMEREVWDREKRLGVWPLRKDRAPESERAAL